MATTAVRDLGTNLKKMVRNFDAIAKKIVERHVDDIQDLQAHQMEQGLNAEGKEIGVLRNPTYAVIKKRKGGSAPLGIVDLKNTGAFQRGINARVVHKAIHIDSTDPKKEDLIEKYGEEIFGFHEESLAILRRKMLPTAKFEILRTVR